MEKSAEAFRTISEVADILDTPAHVLRFWESRFPQIRPVKRAGGRRYYRPSDIALLTGIKRLLHDEGLTIRGVQKVLREQGIRFVSDLPAQPGAARQLHLQAAAAARSGGDDDGDGADEGPLDGADGDATADGALADGTLADGALADGAAAIVGMGADDGTPGTATAAETPRAPPLRTAAAAMPKGAEAGAEVIALHADARPGATGTTDAPPARGAAPPAAPVPPVSEAPGAAHALSAGDEARADLPDSAAGPSDGAPTEPVPEPPAVGGSAEVLPLWAAAAHAPPRTEPDTVSDAAPDAATAAFVEGAPEVGEASDAAHVHETPTEPADAAQGSLAPAGAGAAPPMPAEDGGPHDARWLPEALRTLSPAGRARHRSAFAALNDRLSRLHDRVRAAANRPAP